jgi:ligand-binding sensor domain-containing protein
MKKTRLFIIGCALACLFIAFSAEAEWIHYVSELPHKDVTSIAIDASGVLWIGCSSGGMANFDGTNWNIFNSGNSGMPDAEVNSIATDESGTVWIGTDLGLVKFDAPDWTVYNQGNSELPNVDISSIAIDESGTVWICTPKGLVSFNGTDWTTYNSSNSGLPGDTVRSVAIDGSGTMWIATSGGLAEFNGTDWQVYNASNVTTLRINSIQSIAIDASGTKWVGMDSKYYSAGSSGGGTGGGGLIAFDGTDWTWILPWCSSSEQPLYLITMLASDAFGNIWVGNRGIGYGHGLIRFDGKDLTQYNDKNSELLSNDVNALAVDPSGNIWIGTRAGLSVLKGVVAADNSFKLTNNFVAGTGCDMNVRQSADLSVITYSVPTNSYVSLKIMDTKGKTVGRPVNGIKASGNYHVNVDMRRITNGAYIASVKTGGVTIFRKFIVAR